MPKKKAGKKSKKGKKGKKEEVPEEPVPTLSPEEWPMLYVVEGQTFFR
jgi:hypothetical protein